ncbi:substrate-binding periplasmic protein [Zooshikella sp. RANM57]|uniref:substrate-binding periplasmic protein n=1 Tax=Zooshikella sp. RANM57 TaxID=3425863 RepID=UPI003D6F2D06
MKQLIIIALFSILSASAYCQEVTIVTEDFPPYNYVEDNTIKGLSSQIVMAVLKEINIKAEIKFYPWARAYLYATTLKNHLIYSIARIPEREHLFYWVGTIAPYKTSLYKLKSRKDIKINSLEEAKKYTIGCSFADVITIYLQKKGFILLDQVSNDAQNLQKLLHGRVDVIAYDEASFVYKVNQKGLDISKFERIYRLEELSDDLYMAFSKTSDIALVRKFQDGLRTIKKNGVFDKIQREYFIE